uniref:Uncharacterized protein n=1 Tax=Tanacetum cinerariifolium TaxID=118510 RepID=A0A6L2P5A5_TANCI|nr:hypothetical protein [Tanacetum cinerariifolium]
MDHNPQPILTRLTLIHFYGQPLEAVAQHFRLSLQELQIRFTTLSLFNWPKPVDFIEYTELLMHRCIYPSGVEAIRAQSAKPFLVKAHACLMEASDLLLNLPKLSGDEFTASDSGQSNDVHSFVELGSVASSLV